MQITNKIEASYTLEHTAIQTGDSIKYLGVTITPRDGIYISATGVLKQIELLASRDKIFINVLRM